MRAILMLHGVDDTGSHLSIAPSQLVGLARAIRRSGHAILPRGRLLAEPDRPDCVAPTFDDGFASVAEVAAPRLRDEGVEATLFVTTGYLARLNDWPSQPTSAPRFPLMSWDDVERLHRDGWEIEAHGWSHADLRASSDADVEREVEAPKREIERRLGRAPQVFAYPYGALDDRIVDTVRRHYRYAVTTRMAPLAPRSDDLYRIPRIDTLYLRRPAIHRRFGKRGFRGFRGFISLCGLARRLRGHPDEAG